MIYSCLLQKLHGALTSPLGFTQTLRNLPTEALCAHFSCLSLSWHVVFRSTCYVKAPFRLAWSGLPPPCSFILLSNYFPADEIRVLCWSHLWRCIPVVPGSCWWGICLTANSQVCFCLWVPTCVCILWCCITCLDTNSPPMLLPSL